MLKTSIELSDGTIITSGAAGTAILSFSLTETVNSGNDLTVGSVCAAMAEISLMAPDGCPVAQGECFTIYKESENGQKHKLGVFIAEQPRWISANRVKITAYDNVTRLDRDLTQWLENLPDWPYTLQHLATLVCEVCDLTLENSTLPNGSFPVGKISLKSVTGRQILRWIAQATTTFCRANADGKMQFDWYKSAEGASVGPQFVPGVDGVLEDGGLCLKGDFEAALKDGQLTLSGQIAEDHHDGDLLLYGQDQQYYYQGSLELADYVVAPVEKVQLRQDSADVGTIWPDVSGQANTYILEGNPLLAAQSADTCMPIVRELYDRLKDVTYTPCTVTIPLDLQIKAGDILPITDAFGRKTTLYVMERTITGSVMKLKSTGSANRQSTTVVNNTTMEALSGKVLRLQTDVDGLRIENADTAGAAASVALTVSDIENRVSAQKSTLEQVETQISTLRQDAQSFSLELQKIHENGAGKVVTTTGYTFSEEGLRIKKSGMEMENLLDHTGMYVQRNGQTILQANNLGVVARDVTVENYLIVGEHARFEDFGSGTGCFYI